MRLRSAGFTLIELAVALVVSGVVVVAGHAILNATIDASSRSSAARESSLAASTARMMLTDWLRATTLPEEGGLFRGVHRVEIGFHADELTFMVSDGGSLFPGPHRIHLWVDRSSLTPRAGLLAELIPLPVSRGVVDTLELARAATGLALRHLVVVESRERWVNEWQTEYALPIAIDLRIIGAAGVTLGGAQRPDGLAPLLALPIIVRVTVENW